MNHPTSHVRSGAYVLGVLIIIAVLGARISDRYIETRSQQRLERLHYNCEDFIGAEERLACGAKIPFAKIDQYELERIPGVSMKSSSNLLAAREEIIQKSMKYKSTDNYKSLELAYGIGPKRAKKLKEFIELDRR